MENRIKKLEEIIETQEKNLETLRQLYNSQQKLLMEQHELIKACAEKLLVIERGV